MNTSFIELGTAKTLNYPVGDNITENIPRIREMIEVFKTIEYFHNKNLNIICRGSSGAIIAGIFATSLTNRLKIVHVKKQHEDSHCNSYIHNDKNWANIIVDDFICSGETVNELGKFIVKESHSGEIDCLCVTGWSMHKKLQFVPRYFICGLKDK